MDKLNYSPGEMKSDRIHFKNLDVMRFIAALMIVLMHGYNGYEGWFNAGEATKTADSSSHFLSGITDTVNHNLGLGVDYFFVISGFLITYLLLKEKEKSGRIHIGKFYLRRVLRIWPVYFFIVIISKWWCIYLAEPIPDYRWTISFLNNFQPIFTGEFQFPFIHFWSVCIEEHFYLFWPLLLNFIPTKNLPKLFLTVIAASIFFRIYCFYNLENWVLHVYYNTLSKMDTLAIGSLIAWIHFKKPIELKTPLYIRMLVYLASFLCFCFIDAFEYKNVFDVAAGKYIFQVLFIFWFLQYMFNPKALFAFTSKNIFHYFGKISYGLYMYHNILISFVVKKIIWRFDIHNFWLFWPIFIALTFVISILSYQLVEKHFLKLKDRFAFIRTSR